MRFQFLLWCSKNILFIFQTPCLSVTTIWKDYIKGIDTQKNLRKTVSFLPSTEDPLFWKGAQFTEWETLIAEWWTRIPKRESWFRLTGSLSGEQVPQALHASFILAWKLNQNNLLSCIFPDNYITSALQSRKSVKNLDLPLPTLACVFLKISICQYAAYGKVIGIHFPKNVYSAQIPN